MRGFIGRHDGCARTANYYRVWTFIDKVDGPFVLLGIMYIIDRQPTLQ